MGLWSADICGRSSPAESCLTIFLHLSMTYAMASIEFERLKPLCVDLAKSCNISSLNSFRAILKDFAPHHLQLFQEYLLFPLRLSFNREWLIYLNLKCLSIQKRDANIFFHFSAHHQLNWKFFKPLTRFYVVLACQNLK